MGGGDGFGGFQKVEPGVGEGDDLPKRLLAWRMSAVDKSEDGPRRRSRAHP